MSTHAGTGAPPVVVVLMATHDGAAYLEQQVGSILDQRDVLVRLVVSDDSSSDATPQLLAELARDPRVDVLPAGAFGTPQGNFLRLMREADVAGATAVALADQDDVWHPDKLARQLEQLDRLGVDGVSSNVSAFWERDGRAVRSRLVDKAQPQVALDFLLEAAGPGCTYVMRPDAFATIRSALERVRDDGAVPHDWLAYAVVRAGGGRWHIDPAPTLDYRQHGANATGANSGLRQAAVRVRRLADGDYRRQCATIAALCAAVADDVQRARLERVAPLFASADRRSRRALRRLAPQLRRKPLERRLLQLVLLLGIW